MNSSLMALAVGENLVKFVIDKNGMSWKPPNNFQTLMAVDLQHLMSDITQHVGTAVWNLIRRKQSEVSACKAELEEIQCSGMDNFSRYALAAARIYFQAGYSHVSLLSYCAMVGGVSMMFYESDKVELPNCAAGVIGIMMTGHIMTGKFGERDGYLGLIATSKTFNEAIEYLEIREWNEQVDSEKQVD